MSRSNNRYSRTHSYSMSDAYDYNRATSVGYGNSLVVDEDDLELEDEEDDYYSDGYDDDLRHGGGSGHDSSQYIRREHHNKLEQKRRAYIRDSYTDLKDVMPEYKSRKLSRANILIYSRDKVNELRKRNHELRRLYEAKKSENDREEREVLNSERQLDSLEGISSTADIIPSSIAPLAHLNSNNPSAACRPMVLNRNGLTTTLLPFNQILPVVAVSTSNSPVLISDTSSTNSNNQINSLGTNSNSSGETPSACSLSDSPLNSTVSHSLSSSTNSSEHAIAVDCVDGTDLKPEISIKKDDEVTMIEAAKQILEEQKHQRLQVQNPPIPQPVRVSSRIRSASVSFSGSNFRSVNSNDIMMMDNVKSGNKRTLVLQQPQSPASTSTYTTTTTKRICVTSLATSTNNHNNSSTKSPSGAGTLGSSSSSSSATCSPVSIGATSVTSIRRVTPLPPINISNNSATSSNSTTNFNHKNGSTTSSSS